MANRFATGAGGKGNEGVASNVARAKNPIGYVGTLTQNKTKCRIISLKRGGQLCTTIG